MPQDQVTAGGGGMYLQFPLLGGRGLGWKEREGALVLKGMVGERGQREEEGRRATDVGEDVHTDMTFRSNIRPHGPEIRPGSLPHAGAGAKLSDGVGRRDDR